MRDDFLKKSRRERYAVRDDVVGEGGFEPPKAEPADLQSVPFGHSGIPPYCPFKLVEPVDGFEPPTY